MKTHQCQRDDHRQRATDVVRLEAAGFCSGAMIVNAEWMIGLLDDADRCEELTPDPTMVCVNTCVCEDDWVCNRYCVGYMDHGGDS